MTIAVVTCARSADVRADAIAAADAPVVAALSRLGLEAERVPWRSSVDWSAFEAVLVRTTWDWWDDPAAFRAWITARGQDSHLLNSAATLHWGLDKRFLQRLGGAGVPVLPTLVLAPDEAAPADVARWARHHGWDRLVVKPSLSAGSVGVVVIPADEGAIAASAGRPLAEGAVALAQPYLPSIEQAGELSLIFLDGTFSHAVRKRPKSGDFRVQIQYGATYALEQPDPAARAVADAVLAVVPGAPVLARVDLVWDTEGQPRVIEIEAVEPDLYFDQCPQAADRLAHAVMRRLDSRFRASPPSG
jgi:glutathione synthase/RimK-type ligase-like ATP-grasp enzyme